MRVMIKDREMMTMMMMMILVITVQWISCWWSCCILLSLLLVSCIRLSTADVCCRCASHFCFSCCAVTSRSCAHQRNKPNTHQTLTLYRYVSRDNNTALHKLLTPVCLCHQAVSFGTGQRGDLFGWESNRGPGGK